MRYREGEGGAGSRSDSRAAPQPSPAQLLELDREMTQNRRRLRHTEPPKLVAPLEHLATYLGDEVDVTLGVHPPRDCKPHELVRGPALAMEDASDFERADPALPV